MLALLGSGAVAASALVVARVLRGTSASRGASSRPSVGVQFHGVWEDYSLAERSAVLDRLVEAGVQWVRVDLGWATLQPDGPDSYSDWGLSLADEVVEAAHARGLKVLGMLWTTPEWASADGDERSAPRRPEDYAAAAAHVAARYDGLVSAWEVWNEPNDPDYFTGADPARYTALLRAAYPAVKDASPGALVVLGGTSYNDTEWIHRCYEAGAGPYFDVLATHPYQRPSDLPPEAPDDGTPWRLRHISTVREVMVAHGDAGKEVWFTELGWSSHGDTGGQPWSRGVSRQTQADYLVRTLDLVAGSYPYVTTVFWYRERDSGERESHRGRFGLLDLDLAPKPVMAALGGFLGRA